MIAQPEEFEGVIVNLELMSVLKLLFQVMNWAAIEGDRITTLQAGEMVTILVGGTIERFPVGLGAYLQESGEFERVEGSIDRRQA